MTKREFRNLLCIILSVDSWELTYLDTAQQKAFVRDPVNYFLRSDDERSDIIWEAMMRHIPQKALPAPTMVQE